MVLCVKLAPIFKRCRFGMVVFQFFVMLVCLLITMINMLLRLRDVISYLINSSYAQFGKGNNITFRLYG